MQTAERATKRPFHETIVGAIHRASMMEIPRLAELIKETKIPEGHDEIIAAWNERRQETRWLREDFGVPADLRKQKREAAVKART